MTTTQFDTTATAQGGAATGDGERPTKVLMVAHKYLPDVGGI